MAVPLKSRCFTQCMDLGPFQTGKPLCLKERLGIPRQKGPRTPQQVYVTAIPSVFPRGTYRIYSSNHNLGERKTHMF